MAATDRQPGFYECLMRIRRTDGSLVAASDVIPIADEMRPFLAEAMLSSRSSYVFPDADGKMRSPETDLLSVLRRAMGRAGIVETWEHHCRRCKSRGSPRVEQHRDALIRGHANRPPRNDESAACCEFDSVAKMLERTVVMRQRRGP